jgi:uncharacterized protein YqjF (DUF2071 family)
MNAGPKSSDALNPEADLELAVLVACQRKGGLSTVELAKLLDLKTPLEGVVQPLVAAGDLNLAGERHEITQQGLARLDAVLEGIERQLTPDAPEHIRRYRREEPSLPFAANATWAEAVCVNVRVQPEALRPLIPLQFELDLYGGWAWISLTASRLKDFGVDHVPLALRMNFYQATYRAHVTFTDFRGRKLRGCYFVRSETNSQTMSLTANLLPEFKAHHCATYPILMARQGEHLLVSVDSGDDPAGKVVLLVDTAQPLAGMPARSSFPSVAAAHDFLVDFYDAFSYDPDTGDVFILRIDRGQWDLQVFEPLACYLGYFSAGPFPAAAAQVDSVFYFRNTPYRWLPLLKERVLAK